MRSHLCRIALFLLTASSLAAQEPAADAPVQTVKGTVQSAGTQQPVAGVTVTIAGTRLGAITKADGTFSIASVPVGRHTLHVRSIGYEPATVQILLTSGRQAVVEIELIESVTTTGEVVVAGDPFTPINEAALVSAQTFSIEEVQRYAGGFEDPGRIAQNFAGVTGTDDAFNDIVIRGGSPTELLWRLDGIDIANPNHFASQGASGGPINAINSNILANSEFFTGAFPADYGNRLSSVFDLRTRRGNREKYEFVGQIGFNGIEAMAEGPLPGTGGSFIASYRQSTLQVFDWLGVSLGVADNFVPRYEDANLKIDLPLGTEDNLSLTALGGISNADENEPEFLAPGEVQSGHTEGTDIGAAGLTWTRLLSERMVAQLSVSTQYNGYREQQEDLTSRDGVTIDRSPTWRRRSAEGYHGTRLRLTWAPDPSNQLTAGIDGRLLYFNISQGDPRRPQPDPEGRDTSGRSGQGFAFVSGNWRPSEALTINTGVHAQYFGLNGRFSLEPRLGASWKIVEGQSINAGVGVHRQAQPLIIYFNNPENRGLDYTQSIHWVFGYSNRLASDLLGKIEAYYKSITDAPVSRDSRDPFSLLNIGQDIYPPSVFRPLVNDGKGRAYGVELSLFKQFTDGYYVTATGSLFRQEFAGSDGVWRFGVFDNRYVVNLLAGWEWKVSSRFAVEMSARFTLAGGRRDTPFDLDSSRTAGHGVRDSSRVYGWVYPNYSRLDTRIDFRNNFDGWSLIGYVSVLNTLGRENVLYYWYDVSREIVDAELQLGLIPVGGIRVEF